MCIFTSKIGKPAKSTDAWPAQATVESPTCCSDAVSRGFDGFCTLEPHLLGGGPTGGVTGPELFPKAVAALRTILRELGVESVANPPCPVQFPGPKPHWLFGHLREFRTDSLAFVLDCARKYGDWVPFRLGRRQLLLVSEPQAIEEVLLTKGREFKKHFALQLTRQLLGNGLLNSEGEFWLRQRRLAQPAFLATASTSTAG